jgi:hypothetical protein
VPRGASHALAIANRPRPAVHGRYMVCAALTLVDPIVARILAQLPTFFLYRTAAWRTLVESFAALPLP